MITPKTDDPLELVSTLKALISHLSAPLVLPSDELWTAEDIASYRQRGCRGVLEVAAESVAYVVLQAHGVDSSQYTFNYVAGWATQSSGDSPSSTGTLLSPYAPTRTATCCKVLPWPTRQT